jgi:hypothetical protein
MTQPPPDSQAAAPLDYERPEPPPVGGPGGGVMVIGLLVTIAGAVTWFSAYAGVDNWRMIQIGITITGFGITWTLLGLILRTLTRRP